MEDIQVDGVDVQGFVIGHKARLEEGGPWGHIEHIKERNGKLLLRVRFDTPVPDSMGFPVNNLFLDEDRIDAVKPPLFEIRKLLDDGVVYSCADRRQHHRMLDELDALGGEPLYGIDRDTGKRQLPFEAIAYLARSGMTEQEFFASRATANDGSMGCPM